MDKSLSAEEKLLQLIRKKPTQAVSVPPVEKKVSVAAPSSSDESVTKDKGLTEKSKINLFRVIDVVLILFSLIIVGYMISKYLLHSVVEEKSALDAKGKDKDDVVARKLVLGEAKSIGPYLERLRERDLFQSPWQQAKSPDTKDPTSATGADALRQFKLVGVVLDNDPKAIIEDSQTKETLFISKGQNVGPGVLEDIAEGKIHIKYNGQIVELVP